MYLSLSLSLYIYIYIYRSSETPAHQGKPHIVPPVRPSMQAAGLQCLKLLIAAASPDPQTRALSGKQVSQKTRSHSKEGCAMTTLADGSASVGFGLHERIIRHLSKHEL